MGSQITTGWKLKRALKKRAKTLVEAQEWTQEEEEILEAVPEVSKEYHRELFYRFLQELWQEVAKQKRVIGDGIRKGQPKDPDTSQAEEEKPVRRGRGEHRAGLESDREISGTSADERGRERHEESPRRRRRARLNIRGKLVEEAQHTRRRYRITCKKAQEEMEQERVDKVAKTLVEAVKVGWIRRRKEGDSHTSPGTTCQEAGSSLGGP